jgi:nicotinamidase-related amidase
MPAARRALIVVDVQEEYFTGPLAIGFPPAEESLARIIDATEAAGRAGIPVVIVQHEKPEGAALFAVGSPGWALHPRLSARIDASWKLVTKSYASCFDGTDLAAWLRRNDIDTVTLVGYMTNNCILATAAAAAPLGLQAEVLSDATGAIHVANEAGSASAPQLQETLLTLLQSNFAAVASTADWESAVVSGSPLARSNLLASATQGRAVRSG